MAEKRYYWLKLFDDFFTSKRIKKLRNIAGGDTYTIIYLKMQLKALKTEGYLYFDGVMSDFAEELALDIDENPEDVKVTIQYLLSVGLLETNNEEEYKLTYMDRVIGSETSSTQRVRDFRERQKDIESPKIEAKTNAERQNAYRAKNFCANNGHVPYIEDSVNRKRYGGNYYICFRRDKCECSICGDNNNLCLHHIDGFDETKPQNNYVNKMITLCRKCHSNVHAGEPIPNELLESIGYYDFCNENNVKCNANVTEVKRVGNVEKEIDIEIDKDKDKDIYNNPSIISPTENDKKPNAKKNVLQMLEESELDADVKDAVKEWVAYKKEQFKFSYQPIGFKKCLTEILNNQKKLGADKVCRAINLSIGKGYKGIIWDLVSDGKTTGNSYIDTIKNRVDVVDTWV